MLILPIKKKWFDMILSGEKREEYREIKPYYRTRFQRLLMRSNSFIHGNIDEWLITDMVFSLPVKFRNGYSAASPTFVANCELKIGTGNPDWGAEPGKEYYVLKILEIEPQAETYGFCVYHGIDCDYAGQCIECPHNTEEDTEWFKQDEERAGVCTGISGSEIRGIGFKSDGGSAG